MRVLLAAGCEIAVDYKRLLKVLYVFERKTQYILTIHAP